MSSSIGPRSVQISGVFRYPDTNLDQAALGGTRLYFDLRGHQRMLPDVHGVEVADLDEARQVALRMIRKLRQDSPTAALDWSGWTISAVDPAGAVVFTINLDSVL